VSSSSKTHMENAFSWDDKLPCPCHLRASSQSCCSTHKPPQEGTGDKPALIPGPCEWESKALWLDPFPSILKKQIQDWRDGSSKHEALSSNPNITKKQKQIILKKKTNKSKGCVFIHTCTCVFRCRSLSFNKTWETTQVHLSHQLQILLLFHLTFILIWISEFLPGN
jgi:hypothetical protein